MHSSVLLFPTVHCRQLLIRSVVLFSPHLRANRTTAIHTKGELPVEKLNALRSYLGPEAPSNMVGIIMGAGPYTETVEHAYPVMNVATRVTNGFRKDRRPIRFVGSNTPGL